MMDNSKAAGHQEISADFPGGRPLHVKVQYARSKTGVGDEWRSDPQTAHTGAGDPGFERGLPETCGLCYAASLTEMAVQDEGAS